jgi:hypothetical protein
MSTKSKRRIERRQNIEQSPAPPVAKKDEKQIAGAIVGQLLDAITFGATESPQSVRNETR